MKTRHDFHPTFHKIKTVLLALLLLLNIGISFPLTSSADVTAGADPGFLPVTDAPFDAADLWLDNPMNGLDTYFSGMGPSGTPLGCGDPLMAGQPTRVHVRVHNFGTATARDLTINFYTRQPASIGDGGVWELIGTLNRFGPVQRGAFRDGFIEWTPLSNAPTSIKAVIEPSRDEASSANNAVIEGSFFFAADETPATLPEFEFLISNPSDESSVDMFFEAEVTAENQAKTSAAQDSGWRVIISPASRRLRRGGDCSIHVSLFPPDPCQSPDGATARISIKGFFQPPGQPRAPLGGVTLLARTAKPSAIDLACPEGGPFPSGAPIPIRGRLLERSCRDHSFTPLAVGNQPVTLAFRSPGGQVIQHLTRTNSSGEFSGTFMPTGDGPWSVTASWLGDATHSLAESAPCQFEVEGGGGDCQSPVLNPIQNPIMVTMGTTLDVLLSLSNAQQVCGPFTFSLETSPLSPPLTFATIMNNGDGTAVLRLSPGRSHLGTYQATIKVADSGTPPQSDNQTITINVVTP
jgi:hypothetical protein